MKYRIWLLLGLLLFTLALPAQRRRRAVKKPVVEEPVEDPRITQMLASTQQITFVDSMVVDAKDFISHIPLSRNIGKLTINNGLCTFTSEMGDHRLVSMPDSSIASSDFIGNRWTDPVPIRGIGSEAAINPMLMPDGITLYYAQKGQKSIGGLDIFVTRYDSEKGVFLKPENIGMPFASEADDLFYAIDEFNQLGYFVTNRRQPAGKVCIYVFIPQQVRRVYQTEAYSDQKLRSLAGIQRIADTWTDKQERAEAVDRLKAAQQAVNKTQDFNKQGMTELDEMRHRAEVEEKTLTLMRNRYATASEGERVTLSIKILNTEQQLEQLQTDIRNKEKQIPYE